MAGKYPAPKDKVEYTNTLYQLYQFFKTRGDKPLKHDPRPSELSARVSLPARITGSVSAVPEQRTTHDAEIGGKVGSCKKLSYRLFPSVMFGFNLKIDRYWFASSFFQSCKDTCCSSQCLELPSYKGVPERGVAKAWLSHRLDAPKPCTVCCL